MAQVVAGESAYVVKGHWPFPLDMLRRDGSRPETVADREAIEALSGEHAHDRDDFQDVEISLVGPAVPNTARWESFGWSVPSDASHAFLKQERARQLREKTILDSALAKLDAEERKLVLALIGQNRH